MPDAIPFVDLGAQHRALAEELTEATAAVVDSSRFVLGPEVDAFEAEFAAYCGVRHCVGVSSGTDALRLALLAAGVGPGDEVVTVAHTFVATAVAIWSVGATAVFVDIDPRTACIDLGSVGEAIGPATRAIVPVHLYGRCLDLSGLRDLAGERGLALIEDAAQAHGAGPSGRRAGSVGDLGCFSFYPSKNLGAWGDGGAVTTGDDGLAERLRGLRNYGESRKYEHPTLGYNCRLDEIQAAVLRVKLRHLDSWNEARREHAGRYGQRLSAARLDLPEMPPGNEHVFHLYAVRSGRRDELAAHLRGAGIGAQIHYPIPVHLQPVCRQQPSRSGPLPETERYAAQVLSLPMYPELTPDQVDRVCDTILEFDAA